MPSLHARGSAGNTPPTNPPKTHATDGCPDSPTYVYALERLVGILAQNNTATGGALDAMQLADEISDEPGVIRRLARMLYDCWEDQLRNDVNPEADERSGVSA